MMTGEEKAWLFAQVFALLDDEHAGERGTALRRLRAISPKTGWPSFGGIRRKLQSTAPPEQLEAAEPLLCGQDMGGKNRE